MTRARTRGRCHAKRVAVLADVHGNAVALAEVLKVIMDERPDLVVFAGDLTWGPLPEETWAVVRHLQQPDAPFAAIWIRGNADRHLTETASRTEQTAEEEPLGPRERWMLEAHSPATLGAIDDFVESVVVEIEQLGAVRFCHGSPRSDEELITPATPAKRMLALTASKNEFSLARTPTSNSTATLPEFVPSIPAVSECPTKANRGPTGRCSAPM